MPTYQLNIDISTADLSTIYAANESVILVKSVAGEAPVAWVSFHPFQSNAITWDENYSVYASSQQGGGIIISLFTEQAALPTENYNFSEDGTFSTPNPVPIGATSYQLTNQNTSIPNLLFGLTQSFTVNGTVTNSHPINAQLIPENQHAIFRPLTQVIIFLASNMAAGTIVDPATEIGVLSQATTITFASETFTATVTYDGATGSFVQS